MSVAGQIRLEVLAEVERQLPDMVKKLVRAELKKIQQSGVKPTERPEDQGTTIFSETGTDGGTGPDEGGSGDAPEADATPRGRRRRSDAS
jgi:hypothetical protein